MVEDSRSVSSALTDLIEEIGRLRAVGVARPKPRPSEWLWAKPAGGTSPPSTC
jgi:hypothetical protein